LFEFSIDNKERDAEARKLIFVESAAAMGGVQFSTLYLAQRLNRARWTPIVVSPEEGDLTRECRDAGVQTQVLEQTGLRSTSVRLGTRLRVPNPAAWIWNGYAVSGAVRALQRMLIESRPDLVVTKGLSAHFSGGLAARKTNIPCVWHVQDFISERSFGIYRRAFGGAAAWLPEQIIVDGKAIERQLPRSLKPRITVVHNGVDTNIFRPGLDGAALRDELGISRDHLVVGHVGRMTPWKGQHFLIEAFARIANHNTDVSLLLVGSPVFDSDSYQRRLVSMVAQLGLSERVKFAGYRHDVAGALAAMDVFAFTSIEKDTSPLALLSAMSCGLPIVAFDIAGVRELMASEDQFRLAPVRDVAALSRELSAVISDDGLRQRLGALARRQATLEFSLERYTDRIEMVLLEAVQGARAPGVRQAVVDVQSRRGVPQVNLTGSSPID
jgi:glycosyltransferase involved in cell wall biosynthesis